MTNCTGGHGRCPAKVIDAVWRRVLLALNLFGGFRAPGTLMAVGLMMLPAAAARFWAASDARPRNVKRAAQEAVDRLTDPGIGW